MFAWDSLRSRRWMSNGNNGTFKRDELVLGVTAIYLFASNRIRRFIVVINSCLTVSTELLRYFLCVARLSCDRRITVFTFSSIVLLFCIYEKLRCRVLQWLPDHSQSMLPWKFNSHFSSLVDCVARSELLTSARSNV